jgi:hypothetical protein
MADQSCRACRGSDGHIVLDLGEQPACDYFPSYDDPGPDPVYPLQMWLCATCGLAQLLADPTTPEEPKGAEPAALAEQAADAVARVTASGLLPPGGTVAEYGSPHGGSWLELLAARGLKPTADGGPADVVLDCFGLMHAADQSAALAERAARVTPGGVLLLQYHPLITIVRHGQWNVLRHGHYAYYSTTALASMLAACGFRPCSAWEFGLYGGTVLLAARRAGDANQAAPAPDGTVQALLAADADAGICAPATFGGLENQARAHADALHDWLIAERSAGHTVAGYGAASRAVALLRQARVDRTLLPAIADASPAKQGLRMPGTDIPVIGPGQAAALRPDVMLVFVADLLAEARNAAPGLAAAGCRWLAADSLAADSLAGS